MTASLQGEIRIKTSSIDEAIESVNKLGSDLNKLGESDKGVRDLAKEFERSQKQSENFAKGLTQVSKKQQKLDNLIAKAANTVANFSQRVEKSGASQEQQNRIIAAARAELDRYKTTLGDAETASKRSETANTQLQVSLGELNRDLREQTNVTKSATQSQATIARAVGQVDISYERLVQQIQASAMSTKQQEDAIKRLNQQYQQSRQVIEKNGTATKVGADSQVAFRREVARTTEQMRAANREFRGQAVDNFNKQMRDLSSSVQVALGPLSGVASRLTAFAAIVRRNDVGVAGLVSSFVAFTVGLGAVLRIGSEAERQILALDSQIEAMGLSAVTSSKELNQMAESLAEATLTNAQEAREAQAVLLSFGNIGTDSFERVLLAAQGLSQTFGGSLAQNTRRLGRLLENPIDNFSALTRQGIQFTEAEKQRITVLQQTGRIQEAQNVILEKFNSLARRATEETGGLAGAVDTTQARLASLAEFLFTAGGAGENATEAVTRLNQAISDFKDSDTALQLAKAFGITIEFLGNTLAFVVERMTAFAAIMNVLVAGSLAKASAALLGFSSKKLQAIGITSRFTTALSLTVASFRQYGASATIATAATKGLTFAVRSLLGPLGLALAIGELIGTTDFLGFHERSREANEAKDAIEDMNKSVESVIENLENMGTPESILEALEVRKLKAEIDGAEGEIERLTDAIGSVYEQRNQLQRRNRNSVRATLASEDADMYQHLTQRLAELREERAHNQNLLQNGGQILEDRVKGIQDEIRESERLKSEIEQMNTALTNQINTAKAFVDSEGQRIDSITQTIEESKEQIRLAEELGTADSERIEELRKLIPELEREREEMRANSREKREAEREAQRLIKAQSSLATTLRESALLQQRASGQITEAQYEQALAVQRVEQETERYVASLARLSKESLIALVNTSGLSTEQKAQILTATTAEGILNGLAQAYRNVGLSAVDAENQISGEGLFNRIVGGNNPLNALAQGYVAEYSELVAAGLGEEDFARAARILAERFEASYLEEQRNLQNRLADTVSFTPLTETEQLRRDYEERLAVLREMQAREVAGAEEMIDKLEQNYQRQRFFTSFAEGAQKASNIVGASMEAMTAAGAENTKAYKLMALAQVAISQGLAIARIWENHSTNPAYAGALTALAAAQIGAAAASINSANGFKDGGYVSGAGTSRSDSIPAWLSNGEFVMNAKAVDTLGTPFLNALNQGSMPRFSVGGYVGTALQNNGSYGSSANVVVIDQSTRVNDTQVTTETEFDTNGQEITKVYIRDVMRDMTTNGELDRTYSRNYGLNRKPTRR